MKLCFTYPTIKIRFLFCFVLLLVLFFGGGVVFVLWVAKQGLLGDNKVIVQNSGGGRGPERVAQ